MALWQVRAGAEGEQEREALENQVIIIGWNQLPDLSTIGSISELKQLWLKFYPNEKKIKSVNNKIGQVWRFIDKIKKGDLVALSLKSEPPIAARRSYR